MKPPEERAVNPGRMRVRIVVRSTLAREDGAYLPLPPTLHLQRLVYLRQQYSLIEWILRRQYMGGVE